MRSSELYSNNWFFDKNYMWYSFSKKYFNVYFFLYSCHGETGIMIGKHIWKTIKFREIVETSYHRINNFTVTFYFNLFQLKIVRFNQQNEFFNKMNSPRFSINVTQSLRDHFPFELQIDIVADNIDTRSLQFQVPWHVRKLGNPPWSSLQVS